MSNLHKELNERENYIKLYKFTCSLPQDQSYMLSYLIDVSRTITVGLADDPDFFQCSMVGFIQKLLSGWSEYQIKTAIDKLVSSGYIQKRVVNINNKNQTYIKLNAEKILDLMDKYDEQQLNKRLLRKYTPLPEGLAVRNLPDFET